MCVYVSVRKTGKQNLLLRENGLIFKKKIFLQYADMHKESSQVHGQCSAGVMWGVAGPRPFFVTKLLQENG